MRNPEQIETVNRMEIRLVDQYLLPALKDLQARCRRDSLRRHHRLEQPHRLRCVVPAIDDQLGAVDALAALDAVEFDGISDPESRDAV